MRGIHTPSGSATETDLATAHGAARDAIGAVRNLEQLLKSLRVGPKALSAVIPHVEASCGPLITSIRRIAQEVTGGPLGQDCADSLLGLVTPRVHELERSLADAQPASLHAKSRLALEKTVSQVITDLEGALQLIDLLMEARSGRKARLELSELFRECAVDAEAAQRSGGEVVTATLSMTQVVVVVVNPHVAMTLLGLGIRLMAEGHAGTPHVHIEPGGGDECRLRIRSSGEGRPGTSDRRLAVHAPPLLGASVGCAAAAAATMGGRFEPAPDGSKVVLALPADPQAA